MKLFFITFTCMLFSLPSLAGSWIRINQMGYLPGSSKVAVLISEEPLKLRAFQVIDAQYKKKIKSIYTVRQVSGYTRMKYCYRLDFSQIKTAGNYYLKADTTLSPIVHISNHVYDGSADYLLHYMRQQRCGYNPFFGDSCHTHDAFILYHPTLTGQHIDVTGGWHDATDMLQYATTSANATYQMMFAYEQNPESFGDAYDANGIPGANGIPDILDEAKWGIDWLMRMNPAPGEYYNQIADDRDHTGTRIPSTDKANYGYGPGKGRPVYYCSGEPQQRGKFINNTTGIASTVAKYASCFSLASSVFKDFYPDLISELQKRAQDAYLTALKKPGACQTASVLSPYIYAEENWTDDIQLAAIELYRHTSKTAFLKDAIEYGRREPVTPWMGADSAHHYQWYPFLNVGHYRIASQKTSTQVSQEFLRNLQTGIERTWQKAKGTPFLHGIPYIWCSNNLTVAMLTQCHLYRQLSGDNRYLEMENALLDWLFGCNPWGCSMLIEMPENGIYPTQPHAIPPRFNMGNARGGLVDGPVYSTIFGSLIGISLKGLPGHPGITYERFQPDRMVYHDATGDYSTNEPTMDGTASLTYYLSALQRQGWLSEKNHDERQ